MNKPGLRFAMAIALFSAAPSAHAMSSNGPAPRQTPLSSYPWGDPSDLGTSNTTKLYSSPAACKPDDADPVWGPPGDKLLGFSCRAPRSNRGS